MKKHITFKMWLTVFLGGIWQLLRSIFSWKNKTAFWRVVWAAITVCIVALTLMLASVWYQEVVKHGHSYFPGYFDGHISKNFRYHNNGQSTGSSCIYDASTKKKVLKGLDWLVVPNSGDSLMVVSKDGKRGFVNRFTAETVIPFKYDAAWSFCEGVAAVCEGDSVYFIDHSGQPINDRKFARDTQYGNYVYHGKYAAIPVDGKYGLIDSNGEWAIQPEYSDIHAGPRNMWCVKNGDRQGVIDTDGQFVIPVEYGYVWIYNDDGIIVADADDHMQSRYDYDGTLLDEFVFDEVYELAYYINRFDDNGDQMKAIDSMKAYSSRNFFGLMTSDGIPVTPPIYYSIECVAPGVYQCHISESLTECIMLNGKGEKIN